MEAGPPSLKEAGGFGSWHPALRPNSDTGTHSIAAAHRKLGLQDEDESDIKIQEQPANPTIPLIPFETNLETKENGQEHVEEPLNNAHMPPQMHAMDTQSLLKDMKNEGILSKGAANHVEDTSNSSNVLPSGQLEAPDQSLPQLLSQPVSQMVSMEPNVLSDELPEHTKPIDQPGTSHQEHHAESQMTKSGPDARNEMEAAFISEMNREAVTGNNYGNRTNSFPEVPPLHNSTHVPAHALSKSQAEDILEVDEANEQHHIESQNPAARGPIEFMNDEEDQDFFTNLGGQPADHLSSLNADEEMRFEEGLPLVPSERHQEVDFHPQEKNESVFPNYPQLGPEGDDDADFFEKASPAAEDPPFRPQELDRKTTTQVLDALHYESHEKVKSMPEPDEITAPKDAGKGRTTFGDSTGGGIAVSSHTVESQVFSDELSQPPGENSKEDDLAAMWKAALGDDGLLEEDESSLDPSALFGDDDGFLDDLAGQDEGSSKEVVSPPLEPVYNSDGKIQGFGKAEERPSSRSNRYIPDRAANQTLPGNVSNYQQNELSNATKPTLPSASTNTLRNSVSTPIGFGGIGSTIQQPYSGAMAPQRPQMQASAQSFADKSKGGYTSPYDLPMDVTRPRKRNFLPQDPPTQNVAPNSTARPPPPRSSSMFAGAPPPSQPYSQSSNPSPTEPRPPSSNAIPPTVKSKPSTGSFFEDLTPKPRPPTSSGKYIPTATQQPATHAPAAASSMSRQASLDQYTQQPDSQTSQAYQLRQPEKMALYGSPGPSQPPNQAVPAMNSRYSPAPSQSANVPPPRTRYASSPIGAPQPPAQVLPFQPRTSSPLAQSSVPRLSAGNRDDEGLHNIARPAAPQLPYSTYQQQQQQSAGPNTDMLRGASSPPQANSRYVPLSDSSSSGSQTINTPSTDRLSSEGVPQHQSPLDPSSTYSFNSIPRMPPQRSQTQSPGAVRAMNEIPPNQIPYQRPASVTDRKVSLSAYTPSLSAPQISQNLRGLSETMNYIKPTDGRENDTLERWKGCPIVVFGFGGNVVSSFPVHVPRYAPGQKVPMVKCSPGEVKIRTSSFFALEEIITIFPGPLKAKSKKKEILEWMSKRVSDLESRNFATQNSGLIPDPSKCHEEKILLWKIVRTLVEYDGNIDGNHAAEQVVRTLLSPELSQGDAAALPVAGVIPMPSTIVRRAGSTSMPETFNPDTMEELRKTLLHGDREKAIWLAVDNRMWAHAMLIASTLDQRIWKQVSAEFVKQEVKSFGENTESLSALYQIFSGNGDESIDELVPPSARAGLQMVSKAAPSGPTRNALDGLDRWRETLTLILSNRTPDDGKALVSLGQLLAGYGRIEAAHICYLFAKSPGLFGGPDDPQVGIVLLGADHIRQPFDYARDLDSILLTEVYDFARTILASSSAATFSPHLQSYKLYHAMVLAEYGHKVEAQQYCDAITSALKSTTKLSPYYHPLLFGALENLMDRLRQAPKDGSGSWISKPSIDKVSGSIWAKFNSYVAGEESDTASTGSGIPTEAEEGPFARVAGDIPSLSHSPSVGDLYGAHTSGLALAPASMPSSQPVSSRYAPAGLPTPRSSQEQTRNAAAEPYRQDSLRPTYMTQSYSSRPASSNGSINDPQKPRYQPTSYASPPENYVPTPPTQIHQFSNESQNEPLYHQKPYQPTPPLEPEPNTDQYQPSFGAGPADSHGAIPAGGISSTEYAPPSSGYEPPSLSHEPSSGGGYEPPSYSPPSYDPDALQTDSPTEEKAKKRDIMDDTDDDFEARAAAFRKEERARKDREADELMRKAAEDDAKKDSNPKLNSKKSGWFGGFFGGGAKETKEGGQQQGNAPIKVKLGEESSFYFDKEKGKWVNKKAGPEDEKASAPRPPPPRGPPSRAVSSVGGPPPPTTTTPKLPPMPTNMPTPPLSSSRPPIPSVPSSAYASRTGTPANAEGGETLVAPTSSGLAAPGLTPSLGNAPGPPSLPPSRPTTSQSGTGGLDDLIGAPQQRKGGTVRAKAKRKGYVDVMAK